MKKHGAERAAKGFTSWTQFVAMLFCQLARADSLRDICNGLACCLGRLVHLGIAKAPSRSTLKLAEALHVYLGDNIEKVLMPEMRAVDLGAAPGGWTWQLIHRGLNVIAVDNGPMKGELVDNAMVRHLREDGFRYLPKKPVDWMVCDIVESPSRIATLVANQFMENSLMM